MAHMILRQPLNEGTFGGLGIHWVPEIERIRWLCNRGYLEAPGT